MPLQQDRVKVFARTDVSNTSSIEFKNMPTDFCELKIHGVCSHKLAGNAVGNDKVLLLVEFQNSFSNQKMLQNTANSTGASVFETLIKIGQQRGEIYLGEVWNTNNGQVGEGQSTFEFSVMEPGSTRSKMLNFETKFNSNYAAFNKTCYGQMRVDSQMAASNTDSKGIFNNIKITLTNLQPAMTSSWGDGSTIWLEGWGGGHI